MTEVIDYNGYKLTAVQNDRGWEVTIEPTPPGNANRTMTFGELSAALDEAKKFIDLGR
jgi:hypothetical protein